MQKSKLIETLRHLTTEELNAFEKFVHSPYFHKNKLVIKLWKYLKKYGPNFEHEHLNKIRVFKKLFPDKRINDTKLRQIMSALLKLVEQFLVVEQTNKNEFRYEQQLATAYLALNMKSEYEKQQVKLIQKFQEESFLGISELKDKLLLHHQMYFNPLKIKGDDYPKDLQECTQLLEQSYSLQKLFYAIEWLSSNERYSHPIPKEIRIYIEYLKRNTEQRNHDSMQSIFENAVRLFAHQKEEIVKEIFITLKNQINRNYNQINITEKNLLLKLMVNHCVSQANKGKEFTEETFEVYQLGLSDGAIFYKGRLTNASFINIVSTGLKLKRIQWVSNFIEKESYRLYEPQKEVFLNIANASIHFYKQEYRDCLRLISNMPPTSLLPMELVKRGLKVKAVFECYLEDKKYMNMVYTNIESFSKYLNRKEVLSTDKRNANLNFLKFLKRFINKREQEINLEEINHLKELLIKETVFPFAHKQWLLTHLDTFKEMELLKATPK